MSKSEAGSTFIIVLWIAFGLVSLTLYFGSSMSLEYRAADNRVAGIVAEQVIDGAARYVGSMLAAFATNGALPDPSVYLNQAVPIGEAHFWLIGRDTNNPVGPGQLFCGWMDERSKINLSSTSNNVFWL